MATPIPVFPEAVVTDEQLKVANNRIQTTLRKAIDAGSMSLFVASTRGFVPHSLVTIGSEIVSIDSVETAPCPTLLVADGGRGFDGTAAMAHLQGARVTMLIDAWHHNAVAAEVKAIEEFLGPNGQNIPAGGSICQLRNVPFLVSSCYDFTPQSPGGSLTPGTNAITLRPVPQGVNGNNPNHFLYLSGGTGAAENVLITGGSAVSGAASGTVIVNCASAHAGGWTIASATAGIREAIIAAPTDTQIVIPGGTHLVDCLVVDKCIWLRGCGEEITTLKPRLGSCTAMISVRPTTLQYPIQVSNMSLQLDGFAIEGMRVDYVTRGKFYNLRIVGGTYGIRLGITAQVAWCHFYDIAIMHPSHTGFWINGDCAQAAGPGAAENWFDDLDIQQDSANPMQCGFAIIRTTTTADCGNHYMRRVRVTRVASGTLTNGFLFESALANAVFNVEMMNCVADAISGDAVKMVNCAEVKSTLGWFMSSGPGSTGAAINFNGGYNFSFAMTKVGSQNASAFTYSNSPTDIVMMRNIYASIGQYVHDIPASGGPVQLTFIGGLVGSLVNHANDFTRLVNAMGGRANPTSDVDIIGGYIRFWDQVGVSQVFMNNFQGNLQLVTGTLNPMLTVTQNGDVLAARSVYISGSTKISAGAGGPNGVVAGSPGDLYLNQSGGANNTLWVKESGPGSTAGWIAK